MKEKCKKNNELEIDVNKYSRQRADETRLAELTVCLLMPASLVAGKGLHFDTPDTGACGCYRAAVLAGLYGFINQVNTWPEGSAGHIDMAPSRLLIELNIGMSNDMRKKRGKETQLKREHNTGMIIEGKANHNLVNIDVAMPWMSARTYR